MLENRVDVAEDDKKEELTITKDHVNNDGVSTISDSSNIAMSSDKEDHFKLMIEIMRLKT